MSFLRDPDRIIPWPSLSEEPRSCLHKHGLPPTQKSWSPQRTGPLLPWLTQHGCINVLHVEHGWHPLERDARESEGSYFLAVGPAPRGTILENQQIVTSGIRGYVDLVGPAVSLNHQDTVQVISRVTKHDWQRFWCCVALWTDTAALGISQGPVPVWGREGERQKWPPQAPFSGT